MRAFVFLLILSNLLFVAWTQGYFGASSDPDALRVQQQLLPERIRIITRDEPPAEVVGAAKLPKVAEKKVADVCLRLNDLPIADVIRAEGLLGEKWPAFRAVRAMSGGNASYWVYIPPLASKQDAERKATELKKLRVPEFFLVQDAGPNKLAISLGIFSTADAAAERLAQLRAIGVKSARVGERSGKPATLAALEITGSEAQADGLRQDLAGAFPESKPGACKTPAGSAP